jgi:GntR family transcriptional regulator
MLKTSKPGDQLPPEPVLAKRLGVSRSTLREGLRMFAERGDLVRRHGVGTFVALPSPTLESGLEVLESVDSLARRMGLVTELADLEVWNAGYAGGTAELLLPAGETAQVWAITG